MLLVLVMVIVVMSLWYGYQGLVWSWYEERKGRGRGERDLYTMMHSGLGTREERLRHDDVNLRRG